MGEEPKSSDREEAWPYINDSTLSEGREWRERKREGKVGRERQGVR